MPDTQVRRPIEKTPLINRAQVKKLALEYAKTRAHKFNRVSNDFLVTLDAKLRSLIISHVQNLPSKGMTI